MEVDNCRIHARMQVCIYETKTSRLGRDRKESKDSSSGIELDTSIGGHVRSVRKNTSRLQF